MTFTSLHFLGILLLISTAVVMCLTKSPVCDDLSVYNYRSKSCFRVFDFESFINCQDYKGGEYQNVSGRVADVDNKNLEVFLRDYLQYLRIRKAAVTVRYNVPNIDRRYLKSGPFMEFRPCIHSHIRHLNADLAISISEFLGTPVNWESISCEADLKVLCQVEGAETVPTESSCPSKVTVESVSESNATFHITPGETKTQVQVRFSVDKPCTNLTSSLCEEPVTSLDKKVFLLKPMTLTVFKLEPSTRYRARFEIDGYDGLSFQCNRTVDFTTDAEQLNQEEENNYKDAAIGLSVVLACSLLVIVILATLLGTLRNRRGQDNTSLSPVRLLMSVVGKDYQERYVSKTTLKDTATSGADKGSSAGTTKSCSNVDKDRKFQNKGSNLDIGDYTNAQVTAPSYDEVDDTVDEHTYEM